MIRFLSISIGAFLFAIGGIGVFTHTAAAAGELDICCAWNSALSDGVLTYSVTGGSSLDRDTVRAAIEDWDNAVSGLTLTNVSGTGQTADIKVTLKKGGGVIAGMAKRSGDRAGFVKSVTISISLKAFGTVNDQDILAEVARHEFGHALGLGHADFDDLMDPNVGGENQISSCDVDGVKEANRWKLIDGLPNPAQPSVSSISC